MSGPASLGTPDFLVCLDCESPCYDFEWRGNKPIEALCLVCGNEDVELFATESQVEELNEGWAARVGGRGESSVRH